MKGNIFFFCFLMYLLENLKPHMWLTFSLGHAVLVLHCATSWSHDFLLPSPI